MVIKAAAVEGPNSKTFIRHNLAVCKVLGSHNSVVVDSGLFRCGAVSQAIGTVVLPSSEFFLNCLTMKMKAIQSFKMNGTVPPCLP
jgi:hypothetical protein